MSTSDRAYHHGDLPAALINAARVLLAESGTEALSLRAVARRAGVSAMAPYRHFPDKEALLAAVAADGFREFRAALEAADGSVPPDRALLEQGVAYVRFACEQPALFRLMFGPPRQAPHPKLRHDQEQSHSVLAARVAAETAPSLRQSRTLACWSVVHGLASLIIDGQIDTGGTTPEALARMVAAAFLQQSAPSGGGASGT
ncbi:TetR/AcrR family transcriptional regulator [Acidisoma sp.]|uniref:TetR/AcrR family transcriptional regulator n=1 Tax=Acidisoma sp. TaxID=1872115 RepID=UPI003AFF613F